MKEQHVSFLIALDEFVKEVKDPDKIHALLQRCINATGCERPTKKKSDTDPAKINNRSK